MVVDTSVFTAIFMKEPNYQQYLEAFDRAAVRVVSALTLYETYVVAISRRGPAVAEQIAMLLQKYRFEVVPFDEAQADYCAGVYTFCFGLITRTMSQ